MKNTYETQLPDSDLPAKLAQPARRALAQAGYLRLEQFYSTPRRRSQEVTWDGTKGH